MRTMAAPAPPEETSPAAPGNGVSPRLRRIREVARAHFGERGYDAASMREIASAVGIKISTLYFHCATKEQLLFDVLQEIEQDWVQGLHAQVAAAGPTWTERLAAAVSFHVETGADRGVGMTLIKTDVRVLTEEHRRQHLALRNLYEKQFRDLIVGGIEAGEFRQVDPKLTAFAIVGIGLTVGYWFQPDGPLTRQEVAAHYVDLILHSLASGSFATVPESGLSESSQAPLPREHASSASVAAPQEPKR